ncbi:hypothetical protein PBRA_008404 [Plasmodiophora brassicae]|uniref:Rad60/SUMO-like domain-containing protein n=1 Tax=Plasmodiophora brassicae TaxID=37360 RepID=A0A0G4J0M8_PLABS|nr:hypothetical protein PBRA_008404 [Plasmodiophora brassicae]
MAAVRRPRPQPDDICVGVKRLRVGGRVTATPRPAPPPIVEPLWLHVRLVDNRVKSIFHLAYTDTGDDILAVVWNEFGVDTTACGILHRGRPVPTYLTCRQAGLTPGAVIDLFHQFTH